jgi:hypothetical protein
MTAHPTTRKDPAMTTTVSERLNRLLDERYSCSDDEVTAVTLAIQDLCDAHPGLAEAAGCEWLVA